MLVLDPSVAAKWFLSAEKDDGADRIFDRIQDGESSSAPEIFRWEFQNMLLSAERSGRIEPEDVEEALIVLRDLPINLEATGDRFLESDKGRDANKADVAASFQAAIVDVLMQRTAAAFERKPYTSVVLSGGVAANSALQTALREWGKKTNVPVFIPPPKYCTDNAAMIAAAAAHQGEAVRVDPLSLSADPNLPFELSSLPAF